MATFARYFDLVREMKNAYNHRLRLVESAKQRGIKPTARLFATTVPTVRKWLRRFQQHGPSGLLEHSRARHHQHHKTPATLEAQLVELRKTLQHFGARRLIREFDLPIGHGALERIWREHGLMEKRRRKYQRKQDLAHIKASWALFQQISADTKDLDDIPHYWLQAQRLHLPVISVHRPRRPQRPVVLGFCAAAQRFRERRFRFPHSTASGSLRYLAPRSGLADRQRWRVQGGFPQGPRGQSACAHPARPAHLAKRRGNRSPPRRRRVLRSGKFRQPR